MVDATAKVSATRPPFRAASLRLARNDLPARRVTATELTRNAPADADACKIEINAFSAIVHERALAAAST
jgi:Asp-tRNA(Asn)/Glu-tRNA(Gln) amidotransferase A subunit family amidase